MAASQSETSRSVILPDFGTPRGFGAAIRDRRRRRGMTQADLALAIGTASRFVVDLEAGKETCRLGLALAAAAAVGIDLVDRVEERALVPGPGSDPAAPRDVTIEGQHPASGPAYAPPGGPTVASTGGEMTVFRSQGTVQPYDLHPPGSAATSRRRR